MGNICPLKNESGQGKYLSSRNMNEKDNLQMLKHLPRHNNQHDTIGLFTQGKTGTGGKFSYNFSLSVQIHYTFVNN